MFIGDIFNKKKLNESLRNGEYYTFQVFFDDGSDETLNFSSDDIDWDRVGVKRGKRVVDVKRLGGIQGSKSDAPRKPHDFPDDRGLARAQRAYDRKISEGGFDIPEIPRAPTPKPPADKNVKEGMFGLDEKIKAKIQNIAVEISDIPGYWDWKRDTFTPYGILALEEALGDKKYVKYALSLTADDDYAYESLAEDSQEQSYFYDFAELYSHSDEARHPDPEQAVELVAGQFRRPEQVARAIIDFAKANPQELQDSAVRLAVRQLIKNRQGVAEGSVQDRLHRRHQELRKKSGLPDPDYYKELKASYDIEDDQERLARQAEIKKKYQVAEAGPFSYGAKKPRKGSVADLAAKKRKEQEKDRKPIEPNDQMVGTARVVTNEDVERYLEEMRRAGYEIVTEAVTLCPECGGTAYADRMLAEKQDACYHKVKSRYKVWPSAYASGALVRCRKVGAANWGNKSKK
jgi:hypothetical protein